MLVEAAPPGDVDRLERGAALLGAAVTLRERAGSAVLPADLATYDATLTTYRERLGGERFDGAVAAGRALTVDGAVAAARPPRSPLAPIGGAPIRGVWGLGGAAPAQGASPGALPGRPRSSTGLRAPSPVQRAGRLSEAAAGTVAPPRGGSGGAAPRKKKIYSGGYGVRR